MRMFPAMLAGFGILAVASVQAAPDPSIENWLSLKSSLSFGLGDQACHDGLHRALWRDWRGDWWWAACVADQ
jgi:hypothetical protein